jgi:hypothetical protein
MWNWFNCYLSGRHDFGMWCEPGAIFLRCIHCGKRSSGWVVDPKVNARVAHAQPRAPKATPPLVAAAGTAPRILPFDRVAAR